MKSIIFRTGILIVIRVLSAVFVKTCITSEDCEKSCGVCIDKNPSETECYYPHPEIEIIFEKCRFKHDLCDGYLCENGGICLIEFGFTRPACMCDLNTYFVGKHCEIEWKWNKTNKSSLVKGFIVFFNQSTDIYKSLQEYSIHVFAVLFSQARDLQFFLETSEGFVIRFNSFTECSDVKDKRIYPYSPSCRLCPTRLPPCTILYHAKVQFPYKLASVPGVITRSGRVIGYKANITLVAKFINIMSEYQEIYRDIHPIMVNYEGLQPDQRQYMPVIELQNCGRTLNTRIYYHRRSTISLNAKVKISNRGLVRPVWTLWEVKKFRNEYKVPNKFQINRGYSWTLKPFTLKKNVYRIQLKVTVIFGIQSVANYAECYIEVVKSAAVAIISGGSTKTVNYKHQVTISGEKSYNPDNQKTNLRFFWECVSPKQCEHIIPKASTTLKKFTIPKDVMEYNKSYIFKLIVSDYGFEDGLAFQVVYVSDKEMSVYCLMNCLNEMVPSDPLLIEVKLPNNEQLQSKFLWSINDKVGTEVNASNVMCKSHAFPSYLFCVEPNTLSNGETYYFHAKEFDSFAIAILKVSVGNIQSFSCLINPKKGIQLKTYFNISCSKPEGDSSWTFEFFDKDDSDLDVTFSGRMIATNNLGALQNFKLFGGTIYVYLFDINGVVSQWKQVIELTGYNVSSEEVNSLFSDIEYSIHSKEMELALRKASLISEYIGPRSDKTYIAERMVNLICKIPYVSQPIMKLGLMTVKNFISSLTKEGDFIISPHILRLLTQALHSITRWTDYAMSLADIAIPSISNSMLEQMAKASVEVIEVVLANRNETFLNTELEDLNTSEYEDALQASIQIEASVSHIGRLLSFKQGTGFIKTSVTSSTNMSIISAQSDYLKLVAQRINEDKNSSVRMSGELVKELSNVEELSIQLTTIRYNPFWSCTSGRDISTNLLSLELYNKNSLDLKMTKVDYIKNEIDLFLEVQQSMVSSAVVVARQLDATTNGTEDIDKQLTVLRLDIPSNSMLFLSFSFQRSTDNIRIYISETVRPDYKLVNNSETIITSSNADYTTSFDVNDNNNFVYVGILPGSNVPVNSSVNVTIHFHFHLCLTWLRHDWVSQYCSVGSNSNSSIIHCKCTHLSFFSAIFAVPPNDINPFNDFVLFLTIKSNWFIVVFMTCFLLAFLLLGLWAKCNDTRDRLHRTVLVLEDNFLEDKNYYLLAVFTGCRMNSGTDANIGVQIDGSLSSSHSHILKSSRRKVLQRNSEDWFFVQTPQPLGVVAQIHVWSDNSGRSPDWYCNKMLVYDLQTTVVYTFFVEQWLAFECNEFGEAVLFPASSEDMCDVKRIILENITFGYREGDLSGSILARHPRSRIERLDRVVILLCFIMVALLVSLAFYKVTGENDDEGIDDSSFSFESQDIIISFQTYVISSVFVFLISITFNKAYKPNHEETSRGNAKLFYTQPPLHIPQSLNKPKAETIPTKLSQTVSNSDSYYHRLVRRMRRTFHTLPLSPIALSKSSAEVKKNRILHLVAWLISVLLITFCVFFIILYGLKLGQEESKRWLASISLVLVQEFFIISPLKIVLIGLILATKFERFVQISNYNVHVEDFLEERQVRNDLYYTFLITKRTHQMYKPINFMQSDMLREKRGMQKILHNLVDLLIVIAYIVIICVVTYDLSIKVQSYTNFHVSQLVHLNHKSNQMMFQNLYNRSLYYDYLDSTFITALYAMRWYNNENLKPPELKGQQRSMWWTMDKIMKLVGPPACRQIRVDPKKCSLNQITKNDSSVECIPNWQPDVEDTDDYGYGWRIPTTYEAVHKKSSAWKYVSPSQSARLSRQGESWTNYHGGGYMISLSSERFETERKVQILKESKWVNEFTRVVFLVFTLFNVNKNMFTEVVLIAEHFPFGLYVTRTMINSVQLSMLHSIWNVGFILLILIMIFQIVKMLRLMNRKGCIKYFSEFVNIYQLVITGLGGVSILCFVVNIKVSLNYIEMFHRRGLDVFFEFDKIVYYSVISENSLTILFCCLSFRLFSLWPFGGRSLSIYHTLLLSGKSISRFLVLFFLYTFIFCRIVSYLLNHMLPFSTIYWHWSKSVHQCSSIAGAMVQFILSFSIKLCLVFILMLFRYQYNLEKRNKVNRSDIIVFFKWITRQS